MCTNGVGVDDTLETPALRLADAYKSLEPNGKDQYLELITYLLPTVVLALVSA